MGLRGAVRRLFRRLKEPPLGGVALGALRRTAPISRGFGHHRGKPVDRFYIEAFLRAHQGDVQGRVLEVADRRYTEAFGGDRVTRSDVLHPIDGNPRATLVGDLSTGAGIPEAAYDCLIVTQTLQYIFDLPAAMRVLHRSLAPGGVLLMTAPAISQLSRRDADAWGEHWRFTAHSVQRLLELCFPPDQITVNVAGNVLAAVALLEGLAQEELSEDELLVLDPDYPLVVTGRAVRPSSGPE